jgi:hypothetical protein
MAKIYNFLCILLRNPNIKFYPNLGHHVMWCGPVVHKAVSIEFYENQLIDMRRQ